MKLFNSGHKWIMLVFLTAHTLFLIFASFINIYIGEYFNGLCGIVYSFLGMAVCSEIWKWIKRGT